MSAENGPLTLMSSVASTGFDRRQDFRSLFDSEQSAFRAVRIQRRDGNSRALDAPALQFTIGQADRLLKTFAPDQSDRLRQAARASRSKRCADSRRQKPSHILRCRSDEPETLCDRENCNRREISARLLIGAVAIASMLPAAHNSTAASM